ncbi:MAG: PadR family transcriptional regulator [Ktedonobacterales bacterium]|nr:PadR family transcriptional regulator [Ktedonobacterales bacterium]
MLSLHPMSGYDLKELIDRSIRYFWKEGYGQIYPTLKALEAESLVMREVEHHAGRPDRFVYHLTEQGWEALRAWLMQPTFTITPTRHELLLKLYFGRHASAATLLPQVEQYRAIHEHLLQQYNAIEGHLLHDHPEYAADVPYWVLTLHHGQQICRAMILWCDETAQMLRASQDPA